MMEGKEIQNPYSSKSTKKENRIKKNARINDYQRRIKFIRSQQNNVFNIISVRITQEQDK